MATRDDRLLASVDKVAVGLALQPVLSERINVHLAQARRYGKNWNRQDVIAALVFGGPRDEASLRVLIDAYERASVDDARVVGQPHTDSPRRPGRIARARATAIT